MLERIDDVATGLTSGLSRRNAVKTVVAAIGGVALATQFTQQLPVEAKGKGKNRTPKNARAFNFSARGKHTNVISPDGCLESGETCHSSISIEGRASGMGPIKIRSKAAFSMMDIDENGCFPIRGTVTFRATKKGRRGAVTGRLTNASTCLLDGGASAVSEGALRFNKGTGVYEGVNGTTTWTSRSKNGTTLTMGGSGKIVY